MTHDVALTADAETDLDEAVGWYEGQVPGLGVDLTAAVEELLDRVAENPRQYQEIHRGARRALLHRFPYAVFYLIEGDLVVVIAIDHQARDPERWKRRLPEP